MAGGPAAEVVMFIGSTIAAMVVAAALGGVAADYATGVQDLSRGWSREMNSDLEVVNDPAAVPLNPFRLYVKNTGAEPLASNQFNVMLDGTASNSVTVTVSGASVAAVKPGQLALLTINDMNPSVADHRVVVIGSNGAQDTFEFRRN